MKYGLGISTYFTENTSARRLEIFKKCISSLLESNYTENIYLIDDGSIVKPHLSWLKSFRNNIIIIEKDKNAGISCSKNTAIKNILQNYDGGFLCDDDVIFEKDWYQNIINIIEKTGIRHFTPIDTRFENHTFTLNDIMLVTGPYMYGYFLTFDKILIQKIGYFKKLPYVYGLEHSNFTQRAQINGVIDKYYGILNLDNYIKLNEESRTEVSFQKDHHKVEENKAVLANYNPYEWVECIEY